MPALLADTQFGVTPGLTDQTANIQAAINAAANENTCVTFPAGDIRFSSPITLPAGFQGAMSIGGLGRKVTRFVPLGGTNGFMFDLSAGTAMYNSVDVFGCGFVASAGNAGIALSLSYGTGSLGSVEHEPTCLVSNVAIYGGRQGGGWTTGLALTNCWHTDVNGLYLYGNSAAYTTNAGVGVAIESCYNTFINRLTAEFFSQGVSIRAVCGDSQGIFFDNVHMVECVEGIHAYGTPGGALSTLLINNWMVDNGNLPVPTHRSIVFDHAEDSMIGQGQGLQNGGDSQIIFNSCHACQISPMVSLEQRTATTGPAIQDNSGINNSIPTAPSKMINVSTRGFVGVGVNELVAGFVIVGTLPVTVLIRASGPALTQFGVAGVLPDPKLTLTTAAGVLISSNTVWGGSSQIASAAASVGAFAWSATSKDSALLVTLPPGNYTATVAGASGDTGEALVEVYDVS
jgi:hypothetical protein